MLGLLGRGTKLCDGINRREILRAGGLSLFGITLPQVLQAREQTSHRPGRAKSVSPVNVGPARKGSKQNAPLNMIPPVTTTVERLWSFQRM